MVKNSHFWACKHAPWSKTRKTIPISTGPQRGKRWAEALAFPSIQPFTQWCHRNGLGCLSLQYTVEACRPLIPKAACLSQMYPCALGMSIEECSPVWVGIACTCLSMVGWKPTLLVSIIWQPAWQLNIFCGSFVKQLRQFVSTLVLVSMFFLIPVMSWSAFCISWKFGSPDESPEGQAFWKLHMNLDSLDLRGKVYGQQYLISHVVRAL